MDTAGRALFISPGLFPPRAERLIELVSTFRRLGYTFLIVDWGNLFPWSEERFHCPLTYPEHAVVEVHKRAAESGLTLLPRLPAGGGMSGFLSPPGFKNLRLDGCDPAFLDPGAPGAAKFVSDLLEDMRALLPDLPGVYVDPVPYGEKKDSCGYIRVFFDNLMPRLLEWTEDFPVVVDRSLADDPRVGAHCDSLAKKPDQFCEINYSSLPPTIEIYLDLMLKPSEGSISEGDPVLDLSRKLRVAFEGFLKDVDYCWDLIRTVRERIALSPSMGYSPERSHAILQTTIHELSITVERLTELLKSVAAPLKPLIGPGILRRWGRSKIDPVQEQISQLQARSRQVETWTEAE